jgi:predicted dehydrogenase
LEPVKVGVVGIGNMGVHHARVYSELPQTELVGVVDVNEARGRICSDRFHTQFFNSYRDLFERVEAVNIVAPTIFHYELAMEFLARDIHVLVEKPITVDLIQAKRLVDYAKKRNLVLQVGHLERFNPAVGKLREVLGRPIHLESHRLSYPTNRNLDVGVVWDLMIHDLDILINLVNSPVVEINAVGVSVYSDFEDIAQVHLLFKNGTAASLMASRVSGERLRQLKVTEDSGRTLCLDFINQNLSILRPPSNGYPMAPEFVQLEKKEPLRLELSHFADCVATHKTPLVTGEDGKRALELAMQVLARMKIVKSKAPLPKDLIALAG